MIDDERLYYDSEQLGLLLFVTPRQARKIVLEAKLPVVRMGKRYLWPAQAVLDWINGQVSTPKVVH